MVARTLAGPRTPGVRAQRGGVPTATLFAFVCYAILPVLQTRNSASTPGLPRSADAFGMLASLAPVNCKHNTACCLNFLMHVFTLLVEPNATLNVFMPRC